MLHLVTSHPRMTDTTPDLTIPGPTCYLQPMPDLDIRTIGTGPKHTAMWLDGSPCIVTGLDEIPKVGDRYELFGELWRVAEVRDRVVLRRVPS